MALWTSQSTNQNSKTTRHNSEYTIIGHFMQKISPVQTDYKKANNPSTSAAATGWCLPFQTLPLRPPQRYGL